MCVLLNYSIMYLFVLYIACEEVEFFIAAGFSFFACSMSALIHAF